MTGKETKSRENWLGLWANLSTILVNLWPYGVAALGGVGALVWAAPKLPLYAVVATIAVPIVLISFTLGAITLNRIRRVTGVDMNPDWQMLGMSRKAVVRSPTEIDYECTWRARARRRADTILQSWSWTGSGDFVIESCTEGVRVHQDNGTRAVADIFRLISDVPIKKGGIAEWSFVIRTTGSAEIQKPFFSIGITHANFPAQMSLAVEFADPSIVKKVWSESHVYPGPPYPIANEACTLIDRTATITFKRRVGRRHAICWSYV